eukprot:11165410-Lingulodinium_polyedra.AAC.1
METVPRPCETVNVPQQRAKTPRWEISSALRRASARRPSSPKPGQSLARSTANCRTERPMRVFARS